MWEAALWKHLVVDAGPMTPDTARMAMGLRPPNF